MDYEKEYKEALERAKAGKPLDEVFPELKESEDERIMRKMVEHFKSKTKETWCNMPVKSILAWLEKQKEKPSPGIYWHAIKKGDTLPCRAYLWTTNYEKYHDCFEGRLIPNVENVTVGADMWYLPVDDVYNLPREGVDELPKEQKPLDIPSTGSGAQGTTPPSFKLDVKPAEWSDTDEYRRQQAINALERNGYNVIADWLKSLRPQPHWKPSEEQMGWLESAVRLSTDKPRIHGIIISLYEQLKSL